MAGCAVGAVRAASLAGDRLDCGGGFVDDRGGAFGLLARDVEMGDGAEALGGVGVHEDAFVAEAGTERGGGAELGVDFVDHDVRVDGVWDQFQAGGCADGVGDDAGVGVVFGQSADVVLERVERAGGDDAGLAPAAAECFAMAAGLAD